MPSPAIDMDDPLALPKRDTPPDPHEPGTGSETPAPEAPKRRGRKPGDAQLKADLKEIEDKLTNLLELSAMPMAAAGDVWPAQHVEKQARPLARAIAQSLKDNAQLRARILNMLRVGDSVNLWIAIVQFALPICLYYNLIPGVPPLVKTQFQVPDRNDPGVRQPSIGEQLRAQEDALRSHNGATCPPQDPDIPPAANEPPPPGAAAAR